MNIQTLFNPGDEIFFMKNNKVIQSVIRGVAIEVRGGSDVDCTISVTYLCNNEPDSIVNIKVEEAAAYPSKANLLKAL